MKKNKSKGKGGYRGLLAVVLALAAAAAVAGTPFNTTLQVDAGSSVSQAVAIPITAESAEYIDVLSIECNSLGDATSATLFIGPQPASDLKVNRDLDWCWKSVTNGIVQSTTTQVIGAVASKVPISIQRGAPSYMWVTTNASVGSTTGTLQVRSILSRRE